MQYCYFPFFLMARQLFLHHYFPALYFAIIAACQVYDFVFNRFAALGLAQRPYIGTSVAVIYLALSITAFTLYAPLAYGNAWTQSECKRVKLFDTWDWDCNNFHTTYDQYSSGASSVNSVIPSSAPPLQVNDEAIVTPVPSPGNPIEVPPQRVGPPPVFGDQQVIHREEKLEYRDAQGNVLSPEQVEELRQKDVKFETKYETRTRVLDEAGQEIYVGPVEPGVAPPHPDVEGANPETPIVPESDGQPKVAEVKTNVGAEVDEKKAKPASDGNEATET